VFGLLWYLALMAMAWIGMLRLKDARTRHLAIGLIVSYTFVGLFERRAINGANPMSLLFLMAAMVILRDEAVAHVGRVTARARAHWPMSVPRAGSSAVS
jgi:hypothetical protein